MKVLALGGSGTYGQSAVRMILKNKQVDQLIVARRRFDWANSFAKSLEDKRVFACGIDASDTEALGWLMSKVDLVMNTIGPDCYLAISIIHTAIKAGCHYTDLMSDPSVVHEALKLDEEARQADVTALICLGHSCGLTNILAKHAANQLDQVEYVRTITGFSGGVLSPRSAILSEEVTTTFTEHQIRASTLNPFCYIGLKTPVLREGRFVEMFSLEDGEEVTFPEGRGFFWYYGHGEAITLPRFMKGLKGACHLVGREPEELDVLRELAHKLRTREISPAQAAAMYEPAVLRRKLRRPNRPVNIGPRVGGTHATAYGLKKGEKLRYGCGFTGGPPRGMVGMTGIPFALATEMIINGEITKRGVIAPEACIDPLPFFERYMRYWENPPIRVKRALYEVLEETQLDNQMG